MESASWSLDDNAFQTSPILESPIPVQNATLSTHFKTNSTKLDSLDEMVYQIEHDVVNQTASQLMASHKFLMISKSWCPDCHYVYKIWDKFDVASKVFIIELDKFENEMAARKLENEFTELSGRKWVPTLFFNGELLGTEADLKKWEQENSLEEHFEKAGLL